MSNSKQILELTKKVLQDIFEDLYRESDIENAFFSKKKGII